MVDKVHGHIATLRKGGGGGGGLDVFRNKRKQNHERLMKDVISGNLHEG